MRLSTKDLPSKGMLNKEQFLFEINPFTYKDILEYNREPNGTYIQKVIRDLGWIKKDVGEKYFSMLSYFDFDAIIFIKKSISIPKTNNKMIFNTICSNCAKGISVGLDTSKLEFNNITETAIKLAGIELGGRKYKFSIPSMEAAYNILSTFKVYGDEIDKRLINPILCMDFSTEPNAVKAAVENATLGDISTLEQVNRIIDGSIKSVEILCNYCRKESSLYVDTLMTDFFRLFQINSRFDQTKIILQ